MVFLPSFFCYTQSYMTELVLVSWNIYDKCCKVNLDWRMELSFLIWRKPCKMLWHSLGFSFPLGSSGSQSWKCLTSWPHPLGFSSCDNLLFHDEAGGSAIWHCMPTPLLRAAAVQGQAQAGSQVPLPSGVVVDWSGNYNLALVCRSSRI